jgi:isocitrate lyase
MGADPRWTGVKRPYSAEEVDRLRGTFQHDHTLARMGAERLWNCCMLKNSSARLGALTGNQAVEMVQAGLKAIYLSGWQVAGDANDALTMYPDQSLYPVTSVPTVLRKINNALIRADQIQHMEGRDGEVQYFAPIVADAEAGFRRSAQHL